MIRLSVRTPEKERKFLGFHYIRKNKLMNADYTGEGIIINNRIGFANITFYILRHLPSMAHKIVLDKSRRV